MKSLREQVNEHRKRQTANIPDQSDSNQFSASRVLFLGLFSAQLLASIQVYLSNRDLYNTLQAIEALGYLPVPNHKIMSDLQNIGPAFFGGFFFSLSVGASLTIVTFVAVWTWDNIFTRHKVFKFILLIVWSGLLVAVNLQEFSLMATSYFLIIPAVILVAMLRWMPSEKDRRPWLMSSIILLPILILGPLWLSMAGSNGILNFRDHFLFANSLGRTVCNFYYEYTLYPAELIKKLDQKTLKTVNIKEIKDSKTAAALKEKLLSYNYIEVGGHIPVDLTVLESDANLVFKNRGRPILRVTADAFLSGADEVLKEFSSKSDRLSLFRQFTLFSILFGLPLIVYGLLFAFFRFSAGIFLSPIASLLVASALCLFIGLAGLMPLHFYKEGTVDAKDLNEALQSDCWHTRVEALKTIERNRIEIGDFQAYPQMILSPYVPERYWLVRALGISHRDRTYEDLMSYLDDPNPNVVSMAFYSLGQRGHRQVIPEIIRRSELSNHWYCQLYAYNALMVLGWKQTAAR